LNQNSTNSESISNESKDLQKNEVKMFIYVMIAFTIGMALLLFYDISAWWIWYIYFMIWTLIEYRIAKNINLKWWHWPIIILGIISIDWIVVELIEYIKV
jgi:hypothetical protein